jgi:GNAT superfamily N-acetyltransferase
VSVERDEATFWAGFLRNRNLDATTADDGAVSLAGGYALCGTGTYLQYALAAGSTRALRPDDLAIAEEFYGIRGLPSRFELTDDVLERDGALLTERGYVDEGLALAILEVALPLADAATGTVTTRVTTDRRAWSALSQRTFADTIGADETERLRRATAINAAAASALVIASVDGVDVGAGAVRLIGDLAFLYGGGVLPAYRGAGVHGALLATRLAYARSRGATRGALKTTAEGPAERSALRRGFERTAVRRRLARLVETD